MTMKVSWFRKTENSVDTLVIGIGNVGRQDDGLGWEFLDRIKFLGFPEKDMVYRYQLQVEDADLICNYDRVVFVDASRNELAGGISLTPCNISSKHGFTSHELAPETIMYLAKTLYDHKPDAYILGIQGVEWNLKQGLSPLAKTNLDRAIDLFVAHRFIDTRLQAN